MRRVAFHPAWLLAALIVAAVAVVLARDAMYWDKPLPGVEVRTLDLDRRIAVTVRGRTYFVRASHALTTDVQTTAAASRRLTRPQTLVLPPRPHTRARSKCLPSGTL